MTRLSSGQIKIIERAKQSLIVKTIPEYWNPRPRENDQINRLVDRGILEPVGQFYRLSMEYLEANDLVRCECGGSSHKNEAACIHCGKTKDWAK